MKIKAKIGFIYEHFAAHPNLAFSATDLVRVQQKSKGAFHHALKRLESRGHIIGRWENLGGQAGSRILRYQLTAEGQTYIRGLTRAEIGLSRYVVKIEPVRSAALTVKRLSD